MPGIRKITPEVHAQVLARLAAGETARSIAAAFGVNEATISRYNPNRRTDPYLYAPIAEKLAARTRIDQATGCHVWTGHTTPDGYGRIGYQRRTRVAHALAWEVANGRPVPDGMLVRHTCDNPPCINPAHLLLGTHADNMRDMVERGRSHLGERHGRAKLTDAQADAILRRRLAGERGMDLAAEYGVTTRTITRIVTGENWGHLPTRKALTLSRQVAANQAAVGYQGAAA